MLGLDSVRLHVVQSGGQAAEAREGKPVGLPDLTHWIQKDILARARCFTLFFDKLNSESKLYSLQLITSSLVVFLHGTAALPWNKMSF